MVADQAQGGFSKGPGETAGTVEEMSSACAHLHPHRKGLGFGAGAARHPEGRSPCTRVIAVARSWGALRRVPTSLPTPLVLFYPLKQKLLVEA